MIDLVINNTLINDLMYHNRGHIKTFKPYDKEKWADGKRYKFDTLKEVKEFIDTCDIDFSEEYKKRFSQWGWWEIDRDLDILTSEDNLIQFHIGAHEEWRD